MDNKNELAKEERTIFIVLAIIVLIAIGVLVTWYFTKDKKEEEKDKVTKDKTVETTKKDTSDLDVGNTYTFTPTQTVVISDNVVEEEVPIVEVAPVVETVVEEPKITDYNKNIKFYYLNEVIGIGNAELTTLDNELIKLENGVIIYVKAYDPITNIEVDANGKYMITDEKNITFNEEGKYVITVRNSDGQEYELEILVISEDNFKTLIDSFIISTELNLKAPKYYDWDLYNEFLTAFTNFKNMTYDDLEAKREAYFALDIKLNELNATFNKDEYNKDLEIEKKKADIAKVDAKIVQAINSINSSLTESGISLSDITTNADGSKNVEAKIIKTDSEKTVNDIKDAFLDNVAKTIINDETITSITFGTKEINLTNIDEGQFATTTDNMKEAIKAQLSGVSGSTSLPELDNKYVNATIKTINGAEIKYTVTFKVEASEGVASPSNNMQEEVLESPSSVEELEQII